MKTLSIDFASHEGHLACVAGVVVAIKTVSRVNDAEFLPLLDALLGDAGWKKEDIERIACNLGPGGFTSVRGGVAFANALADQLKVPLAGYHGSDLALARCPADTWIHSTRRDQAFVRGGHWTEPTLVPVAELAPATMSVTGDLLPEHRELLADLGATFPPSSPLEAALPSFLSGLEYDTKQLVPWYGRGI